MDPKGQDLYDLLVELSGLEAHQADREFKELMQRLGIRRETLTTEEVRLLMATYLMELNHEFVLSGTHGDGCGALPQA